MEKKWYHSSNGSGSLSLTIRGALVAIVPIIVAILASQGINIDEIAVVEFIDSIFAAAAAVLIVAGLGRKLYYRLKGENN